jgi:hypothetical protein
MMAFETYLSDTRARPAVATAIGYIATLGLHGPPLALFVSAWLTHSLLIGYSAPTATAVRFVPAYQIPSSLLASGHALGDAPGSAGGGKPARRRGVHGRSGRSARRGLVAPRSVKPLPDPGLMDQGSFLAWLDASEGLLGGTSAGGNGTGTEGKDSGDSGDGNVKESGGGGSGLTSSGTAGAAVAVGTPPEVAAPARPKPPTPAHGHTQPGAGNDQAPADQVAEEEDVLAAPSPGRPYKASYLSESVGKYFRTYEVYPSLIDSYWSGGTTTYLLAVEICVSTDGEVSNVTFQQGANEDVDKLVATAIRSWRYRPRIVGGSPRPFCHPIRIEYTRAWRPFAR